MKTRWQLFFLLVILALFAKPLFALAQIATPDDFNPNFIISDQEMQDYQSWGPADIQRFLTSEGSALANYSAPDVGGTIRSAAYIIYDASQNYQINPKFLLTTLQKEESLVTDNSPSQIQLDWATGYGVCDSCNLSDPSVQKFRGFGKQVDGAASLIRWYYDNEDQPFVKKANSPIVIDNEDVTPQNWATAFLYTYTPHLHGNKNFWHIWNTWFSEIYPDGTLLKSASTSDYWLIENGERRKFINKSALLTRADPKDAITVADSDLANYIVGPDIAFPDFSLLQTPTTTYLLDNDTLRPFASEQVVADLGYNPQEVLSVMAEDLSGYPIGSAITPTSTNPEGVIYQISDAPNTYYLLKDGILNPILSKQVIDTDFRGLPVETHSLKDLANYQTATLPLGFTDGTLLQLAGSSQTYVVEDGKKRPIADDATFNALGYKKSNLITINLVTAANIPTGDPLYVDTSLLSSRNKFLGDTEAPVPDLYPGPVSSSAYLIAEYPSGRIISGKNIDDVHPIASLTKLLTGYEALHQNYNLNQVTTYYTPPSTTLSSTGLHFKEGEKVKNKDMLETMYVISSNIAAQMVARGTGLSISDFVQKVNERLSEWGADNTSIADTTGLDANNVSSARDLLKIFINVTEDSDILNALGQVTYVYHSTLGKQSILHTLLNTNHIFGLYPNNKRNYNIIATKTGYTDEAQSTLIMLIQSKTTGQKYVIITLDNPDYANRFVEPNKLASWIASAKLTTADGTQ